MATEKALDLIIEPRKCRISVLVGSLKAGPVIATAPTCRKIDPAPVGKSAREPQESLGSFNRWYAILYGRLKPAPAGVNQIRPPEAIVAGAVVRAQIVV